MIIPNSNKIEDCASPGLITPDCIKEVVEPQKSAAFFHGKKIIRVFPRKTKATPDDENVRIDCLPGFSDEADEIHISVAFIEDIPQGEYLAEQWKVVAPVKVGGPAYNDLGGEFTPGLYLKKGYLITSRGCPNNCWFCDAWRREGRVIRELEVKQGFNILDNNFLACSRSHQEKVFSMLSKQHKRAMFTGGLEAAKFTEWHAQWLAVWRPQTYAFAYDEPADLPPLLMAAEMLRDYKLIGPGVGHTCRCYVLVGYPKDTMEEAEKRLKQVCALHIMPEAMLYDKEKHRSAKDGWVHFQKEWIHPVLVGRKMKLERAES